MPNANTGSSAPVQYSSGYTHGCSKNCRFCPNGACRNCLCIKCVSTYPPQDSFNGRGPAPRSTSRGRHIPNSGGVYSHNGGGGYSHNGGGGYPYNGGGGYPRPNSREGEYPRSNSRGRFQNRGEQYQRQQQEFVPINNHVDPRSTNASATNIASSSDTPQKVGLDEKARREAQASEERAKSLEANAEREAEKAKRKEEKEKKALEKKASKVAASTTVDADADADAKLNREILRKRDEYFDSLIKSQTEFTQTCLTTQTKILEGIDAQGKTFANNAEKEFLLREKHENECYAKRMAILDIEEETALIRKSNAKYETRLLRENAVTGGINRDASVLALENAKLIHGFNFPSHNDNYQYAYASAEDLNNNNSSPYSDSSNNNNSSNSLVKRGNKSPPRPREDSLPKFSLHKSVNNSFKASASANFEDLNSNQPFFPTKSRNSNSIVQSRSNTKVCPTCTYVNSSQVEICDMCEYIF